MWIFARVRDILGHILRCFDGAADRDIDDSLHGVSMSCQDRRAHPGTHISILQRTANPSSVVVFVLPVDVGIGRPSTCKSIRVSKSLSLMSRWLVCLQHSPILLPVAFP